MEDEKAEKLASRLHNLVREVNTDFDGSTKFYRTYNQAHIYFMGCNALKCGRDSISCEDIVVGYLCVYKILMNNWRPFVYSLYDKDKWADAPRRKWLMKVCEFLDKFKEK